MNVIFLTGRCNRRIALDACTSRVVALLSVAILLVGGGLYWHGYQSGLENAAEGRLSATTKQILSEIEAERAVLERTKGQTQAHLDALATRMAELQANVMRLNAVGERLVSVAQLDAGEFDFSSTPAVGGAEATDEADSQSAADIIEGLDQLVAELENREQRLSMLEDLLTNRQLLKTSHPSGRPVKSGWMSSKYGYRTDPFNGKKNFHRGVDFAGKPGTDVISVADGVVTRSEKTKGYGNVLEIRHANGYSTRYAHNKENLVKVGDVVAKGDRIALLGSTGRSRGPHVHFEVRKEGRVVDPKRFVAAR